MFRAQSQAKFSFFICCASPISGVRHAAPIVLLQHEGHERIGKAWKCVHHALPVVMELAK